jgi:hypothetical protein
MEKKQFTQPFKIPMQSEVARYMKEKKGWPETFCAYYAEKFWNFYTSNGWKVSGRAAMKNWQSAFCSNWQSIKFKEDVEMLNKCIANDNTISSKDKQPSVLNNWLTQHLKHWDKITDEMYAEMYDYMKPLKIIQLTDQQKKTAKAMGNIIAGKAYCVKTIFDQMITYNVRFNDRAEGAVR